MPLVLSHHGVIVAIGLSEINVCCFTVALFEVLCVYEWVVALTPAHANFAIRQILLFVGPVRSQVLLRVELYLRFVGCCLMLDNVIDVEGGVVYLIKVCWLAHEVCVPSIRIIHFSPWYFEFSYIIYVFEYILVLFYY